MTVMTRLSVFPIRTLPSLLLATAVRHPAILTVPMLHFIVIPVISVISCTGVTMAAIPVFRHTGKDRITAAGIRLKITGWKGEAPVLATGPISGHKTVGWWAAAVIRKNMVWDMVFNPRPLPDWVRVMQIPFMGGALLNTGRGEKLGVWSFSPRGSRIFYLIVCRTENGKVSNKNYYLQLFDLSYYLKREPVMFAKAGLSAQQSAVFMR